MSGASGAEREERALDALIASGLRRCDTEDEVDPEQLPELSAGEKKALAALGPEFVSRLLTGRIPRRRKDEVPRSDDALATVSGVGAGLNRAGEMDSDTLSELAKRRQEIIKKKTADAGSKECDGG